MHQLAHLTPRERLLVALIRRPGVRAPSLDASAALATADDRHQFLRLACELGVEGLVLSALRRPAPLDPLPTEVIKELDTRWDQLRRQAVLWDLERERVLHALKRLEIAPLLLKGSALREVVFSEPAERSMGDMDLLVTSAEIEPALGALRGAGYESGSAEVMDAYRRHHFHFLLTHPRGFVVELHWALSEPQSAAGLNEMEFLARARTSNRAGNVPVRVPSPEDLLLHVVSQNADDAFGLLRRVTDLDRIVAASAPLDWDYIASSAKKANLDCVLAVSLRLSQCLLNTEVPAPLATGRGLPGWSRSHIAMLQPISWVLSRPVDRRHAAHEAIRLWCSRTWGDRARKVVALARGADPLGVALEETGVQPEGASHGASAGLWSLAKLALYQLHVYAQSGLAVITPAGRSRLRFWS